jgi:hypothetical protein
LPWNWLWQTLSIRVTVAVRRDAGLLKDTTLTPIMQLSSTFFRYRPVSTPSTVVVAAAVLTPPNMLPQVVEGALATDL